MLEKFREQLQGRGEIYLKVKAKPGAAKTLIKEVINDGTIKIDVVALPVKGKANQELIKFLAQEFAVPKDNVKIISGLREKVKLIKITSS